MIFVKRLQKVNVENKGNVDPSLPSAGHWSHPQRGKKKKKRLFHSVVLVFLGHSIYICWDMIHMHSSKEFGVQPHLFLNKSCSVCLKMLPYSQAITEKY